MFRGSRCTIISPISKKSTYSQWARKKTAFAINIEFGSFGSKFARHVKSLCDLLKDLIVPEDGIRFEFILVRLRSAPVYDHYVP
jgi:hypothetical protein